MKKKIIWLIVFALVILLGFAVKTAWEDFIQPYTLAKKATSSQLLEETDGKKIIEESTGIEVREFTEDEKEKIENGEKTENEVMDGILNESVKKGDTDKITAKYLSQIYALQSTYTGKIEGLIAEAKTVYYDKRINQKVSKEDAIRLIGGTYYPKFSALEGECDSKLNSIVAAMERELKSNNCDTSVVSAVKKAYQAEKTSKRAYYMKLVTSE